MISFPHVLVIVSGLITISGASLYIRDTLRGKTKPNRVSWLMWSLAPITSTVVALSAGADWWATSRVFISGFLPLIILTVSFFNPQGYWKLSFFDVACGFLSAVAIVVWLMMDSSGTAIILLLIGDAFACLPTIRKAWSYPETETGLTYVAGFIAVLIVFPAIPVWNIQNSAFQIYLLIANSALLFSVYRKRIFA